MRTCEEVLDLVPEVLPHLPPLGLRAAALEVQEHLRLCPSCADAADELARVVGALQLEAAPAPVLSDDFADRVMAALPPAAGGAAAPALGAALLAWRLAAAAALFAAGFAAAAWTRPHDAPAPAPFERPGPALVQRPAEPLTPAQGQAPATTWVVRPARPRPGAAPLERYVTEANLVLEAVAALERPDPHWLQVISRHVEQAALLDQGEVLLVQLQRAPDQRELRPLISATQVVLRKVRHAPDRDASGRDAAATLATLRDEVREAGLLDAYRALLTAAPDAPPTAHGDDPL